MVVGCGMLMSQRAVHVARGVPLDGRHSNVVVMVVVTVIMVVVACVSSLSLSLAFAALECSEKVPD